MADQDKPTPVALNLDKLEREGAKDPFVIKVDDNRVEFVDAQELDWRDLADASIRFERGDLEPFLRLVVAASSQDHFFGASVPAWKLNRLAGAYWEHYGIDPGNSLASRR